MGVCLGAILTRPRVGWSTNIAPAWDFDLGAIANACEVLGVKAPVVVGCAEYPRGRWGGMHSVERGEHRIRVRRAHSAAAASRTLWHELSHAAQSDRGVEGGTAALSGAAYTNDPREREARAAERNHDERFALVK